MEISDWVLVITKLFLGAIALLVPWLSEVVKRKLFAPKLKALFELNPPYCHKTHWDPGHHDVYFFRFMIENVGGSRAISCEVVLEDFWIYDASGTPVKFDNFSPVNLNWVTGRSSPQFVDINRGRRIFCSLGHLSAASYQQVERNLMVDIPGCSLSVALRFLRSLRCYESW